MTTDNFYFYLQNRLIQTTQAGGKQYSDTSPFSIPWFLLCQQLLVRIKRTSLLQGGISYVTLLSNIVYTILIE